MKTSIWSHDYLTYTVACSALFGVLRRWTASGYFRFWHLFFLVLMPLSSKEPPLTWQTTFLIPFLLTKDWFSVSLKGYHWGKSWHTTHPNMKISCCHLYCFTSFTTHKNTTNTPWHLLSVLQVNVDNWHSLLCHLTLLWKAALNHRWWLWDEPHTPEQGGNLMKMRKGRNISEECFLSRPEVRLIHADNHKLCLVRGVESRCHWKCRKNVARNDKARESRRWTAITELGWNNCFPLTSEDYTCTNEVFAVCHAWERWARNTQGSKDLPPDTWCVSVWTSLLNDLAPLSEPWKPDTCASPSKNNFFSTTLT